MDLRRFAQWLVPTDLALCQITIEPRGRWIPEVEAHDLHGPPSGRVNFMTWRLTRLTEIRIKEHGKYGKMMVENDGF